MKPYFFIVIFLFFSCNNDVAKQEDVISEKVFTLILKKIHLAEASFELQKKEGIKEAEKELAIFYQKIFNLHQISEEDFNNAIKFYSKDPEKLEKIYSNVINILEDENSKIDLQ